MLWEPTMCCCFTRRTGSLILGTIVLVCSGLSILGSLDAFATDRLDIEIKQSCATETSLENCEEYIRKIVMGIVISGLILNIIQMIFCGLLIHGILKNKTRFLVPFMIYYLIQIILVILIVVIAMGFIAVLGSWQGVLIMAVFFGPYTFLLTYFLLVVRAHYLDIKRTKAQAHMVLKEEGFDPVPYCDTGKPPQY